MIRRLASQIDRALRGEIASTEQLEEGRIDVPVLALVVASLVLGAFYGVMMGLYGATNRAEDGVLQLIATTFKVPLLFLLTLVVTYPSLYVFSALARSRLGFVATLRLLLVAITINLTVLASFGPVTAFFTLSTKSHAFMVLLNVIFFAIAGAVGLGFVTRALGVALQREAAPPPPSAAEGDPDPENGPRPRVRAADQNATPRRVFTVWLVIYCVVGAQMAWIMRPFVGDPSLPFEWFRARDANFFAAMIDVLSRLFR